MPKAGAYYLYMLDFKKEQERKHGSNLNLVSNNSQNNGDFFILIKILEMIYANFLLNVEINQCFELVCVRMP